MISKTCKSEEEKEEWCIPPKQRGTDFRTKRRQGVQVPGALPPLHLISYNSSKRGGSQGPPPTWRVSAALSPSARGRSDPPLPCSSAAAAVGPYHTPGGPGSSLFGSTQRTIVLDKLIPTPKLQAPSGGLKALTGVLGGPQDNHLPLCSGGSIPGTVRHPQPRPGNWDTGGSVPSKVKAFGTFPTVQTFLNPTPHPSPHSIP